MTEWRNHTGTERPSELAAAQIVFQRQWIGDGQIRDIAHKAERVIWRSGVEWYPALDPDGLPYVSAEGLEDWAEYVAMDPDDGNLFQFEFKPELNGVMWDAPEDDETSLCDFAPDTHAIPGDPEHSLARVWRE